VSQANSVHGWPLRGFCTELSSESGGKVPKKLRPTHASKATRSDQEEPRDFWSYTDQTAELKTVEFGMSTRKRANSENGGQTFGKRAISDRGRQYLKVVPEWKRLLLPFAPQRSNFTK